MDETLVTKSPDILGGIPVFAGTRVPIRNLIDYLSEGKTIFEFLEDFPSVRSEQVLRYLEEASVPVSVVGDESSH